MEALTEYLRKVQDPLLARWRELSRQDQSIRRPSRLSYGEFLDDIPHLLSIFCRYLNAERNAQKLNDSIEVIRRHGRERWKQDFNLEELLRDLGHLNQVVLEAVNRFFDEASAGDDSDRSEAIVETSRFFSEVICASVVHFNDLQRTEALEKVEELEQMRRYFEQIAEARRRLLSEASHDIGGSLTAISGVSEMLKPAEAGSGTGALAEFREIIDQSVTEATTVLDALLQLAHIDAGQISVENERQHLGGFLRGSIEAIASEREIAARFDESAIGELEAEIDPVKLRRTLEVLFDFAKTNSCDRKVDIVCRLEKDRWTLTFHFAAAEEQPDDGVTTSENRREMDRLLIKRFCLLQNASCKIREGQGETNETVVHLEFLSSKASDEADLAPA
ncbi:MAG TPA: RsbRD N-terminal domain-containing protein [Opitutales bacterium]|nr:RsbRD N-terminal domain-containing protein [Opitutales bacterium]